jgi:glycosyltransferase involved in cell wall biosynthesis
MPKKIKEINKNYKIAIVSSTPFYYHIPFYQKLFLHKDISSIVYYCSDETVKGKDVKRMYNTNAKIVNKDNLLNNYKYKFLKNYSPNPSFMNWPFGLMNFGICKEIVENKYDIVILQSWTNLVWWLAFITCLLTKTKVMFMTDSNILSEPSKSFLKIFLKKTILGNFLFKHSFGFLTSGMANEDFYKYYGVTENKIIRSPFSWGYEKILEIANGMKSKREYLRKSFNIDKNDFVVLYIGRLSKEKNPLIILDAYNNLKNKNVKLFIVGDGPMRKDFEKKINSFKIKNINMIGFIPHKRTFDFYAISDVLILPSEHETWGIVINEAMCFGLPIIASNRVGSAVDLVKDGYNGFIFPFNDNTKLTEAIDKIIDLSESDRNNFGEKSLDIITSWINNSDSISKIIEKIKN